MFCQYCGTRLASDARFCPKCGSPVASAPVEQSPQSVGGAPDTSMHQQLGTQGAPIPPASYSQQSTQQFSDQQPSQQPYGQQPGRPLYGAGGQGQGGKRSTSPVLIVVIVLAVIALVFVIATALGAFSSNKGGGGSSVGQTPVQTTSQASSASGSNVVSSTASSASSEVSSSSSATSSSSSAKSSASGATGSSSSSADSRQSEINKALAQGYQVYEGTLRVLSNKELATMQGVDPSLFAEGTVAVLVFDEPVQVSGMGSDGSGLRTKSSTMLGVAEYTNYGSFVVDTGNLDSWRAYDGKQVTVGAMESQIWFPSDVSLPVGEPRTEYAVILG